MHLQNGFATADVGQIDRDLAVEAAGTQQRGIENIRPVGRRDDDDAFLRIEAVHLHEQRIQGLLAFVVPAAQSMTATPAHGVDFIDENETRRVLARLFEHVAHAAGAHADEHFHKIRAADAEEGGIGFAGDRLGEEGFARARRTHHQDTLRDAPAQALKFFRILEKLDEFGNLFDGLVDSGHVLEGCLVAFLGQEPRLAFAKAERALAGHFDLADEKEPDEGRDDDDGQHAPDNVQQELIGFTHLKLRKMDELLLEAGRQQGLGPERHLVVQLVSLVIGLVVHPDDVRRKLGLGIEIERYRSDLVCFELLLELCRQQCSGLQFHPVLEHHQHEDAADDGYPHNPGARWDLEIPTLLRVLVVVAEFIVFWHDTKSRAPS